MTVTDPLNSTLPPGRHGLPKEFVEANQRTRLITGFAQVVGEKGYCATTIARVCKAASVSRKTFYEHFDGKGALATALMSKNLGAAPAIDSGVGAWVVESLVRAEHDSETVRRSLELMSEVIARIQDIEDPPSEPLLTRLPSPPPGERPRLSKTFVEASQRQRLVAATARVVVKRRYANTRVSDIVTEAQTARNTFYDQFASKEMAARGMMESLSADLARWVKGLKFETGFGAVVVELAASRMLGKDEAVAEAAQVEQFASALRGAIDRGVAIA